MTSRSAVRFGKEERASRHCTIPQQLLRIVTTMSGNPFFQKVLLHSSTPFTWSEGSSVWGTKREGQAGFCQRSQPSPPSALGVQTPAAEPVGRVTVRALAHKHRTLQVEKTRGTYLPLRSSHDTSGKEVVGMAARKRTRRGVLRVIQKTLLAELTRANCPTSGVTYSAKAGK